MSNKFYNDHKILHETFIHVLEWIFPLKSPKKLTKKHE